MTGRKLLFKLGEVTVRSPGCREMQAERLGSE